MFNPNIVIDTKTFRLNSIVAGTSIRVNGTSASNLETMTIAHSKSGKGKNSAKRILVRFDLAKQVPDPTSDGNFLKGTASAYTVFVVPQNGSVDTDDMIAAHGLLTQWLSAKEGTGEGDPTNIERLILNDEP